MDFLINCLEQSKKFQEIIENIKQKISPITISGLSDVGKVQITGGILQNTQKSICIITYNEIQAKKLVNDCKAIGLQVYFFPKKEIAPYDYIIESKDLLYERIQVLNAMYLQEKRKSEPIIIITTIEACMQDMLPKEKLYTHNIDLAVGKLFSLEKLKEQLVWLGYDRNELVEAKGQFSIRGGIVDIGLAENKGVRIEFWGDEVDSIRFFTMTSQRSTEMLKEFTIFPAHELMVDNITEVCKKIEKNYENTQEDIEFIKNGEVISKVDKYFNEFYEKKVSFLDYLHKDYLLLADEINKINQRKENLLIDNQKLIESLIEKERFVPEAIQNMNENGDVLEEKRLVYLEQNQNYQNGNRIEFSYREIHFFQSEIDLLIKDLEKDIKTKKMVILLAGNETNAKKVCHLLNERELIYTYQPELNVCEMTNGKIIVSLGSLSAGFECYELNMLVISMQEGLEEKPKRKKLASNFKQAEKIVFADLKQGDFVVHKTHGIGQFVGVNTITADTITKDYIKIKYKNEDVLYVPTSSLDNVRKYIGGGESGPKLNKLGGKDWSTTTAKVKKNLQEIAKDLVELYAKRQKIKGFAYNKDNEWQRQFEDNFAYQETDDQLRCIEEVKKDMEKEMPMDRLLCGDVGYGKTEVAIRAAFKAVMDQKQVAYLVPTTILANQQYEEFKTRMQEFAIHVELLNRFRTKKEQEEVIKRLQLGEVDVVVGTHRLLSQDVLFKDLGLLIIDEEHRFGVKDKEKIKKLKNNVDVLTMTATPIPRTMHMSIVGVRDMSVIYEPPQNRKPVQTYVLEYDEEILREAITKELERNGQVFYLYNKVETIERKANQLENLIPEAKVGFAHGKMTGTELEEIMESFVKKEINVLVCTTILESGIDIPNANTIIVENADRLGLAQLYQIRGRVGRSDKQAYAYITYQRDKMLSEVADKRLKAMKEFTEFGSGFKIAMRDLEIRGAGSMLRRNATWAYGTSWV